MVIKKEIDSVTEFIDMTWSGGRDTLDSLTWDECEQLLFMLDDLFCDSEPTETEVNDFLWFERDTVAEWLGFSDFDEILARED